MTGDGKEPRSITPEEVDAQIERMAKGAAVQASSELLICCFGIGGGVRCGRTAYYASTFKGERSGLVWCAKHRPRCTSEAHGVIHLPNGREV